VPSLHIPHSRRGLLTLGAAAALVGGAAAYRKVTSTHPDEGEDEHEQLIPGEELETLGWGMLETPEERSLTTPDGARLALWDVGSGPTVVLAHCWSGSHAVWIPVARRLVESGHRVVLYDHRGHGESSRGRASLNIETLADDLAAVLVDRHVTDAVLAGHSMGGMAVMALATYHPEVLAQRVSAVVLVATAAADMGTGPAAVKGLAAGLVASPAVSLALRSPGGHRFVRGVFGADPTREHLELTRTLMATCAPLVRASFLGAISTVNLLEGITTIGIPTTVVVGSRDRLTAPARSHQMVQAIPGARLVTLPERGHMLPLEDADAVTAEIERSIKGRDAVKG
jgi:non-heme chloroperoxidase